MFLSSNFSRLMVLLCLSSLSFVGVHAEIYKYKDENGRWQFTDRKPQESVGAEQVFTKKRAKAKAEDLSDAVNLAEQFEAKYKPQSAIDRATLAVMTVKTSSGLGSGFFISNNGYIVTNKHVIRPKESTGWQAAQDSLDKEAEYIRDRAQSLAIKKSNLAIQRDNIDIITKRVAAGRATQSQLSQEKKQLKRQLLAYKKLKREIEQRKADLARKRSDFARNSAVDALAKSFKVVLKNNTTYNAQLIKISKDYDRALTKLDGHITPYLNFDQSLNPYQSMSVFAIGSPLGHRDAVTSGIATTIKPNEIVTDATILPGNSGGPLLDENASLLGVNTRKLMASSSRGSEGFGVAISMATVKREFAQYVDF